MPLSPRTQQFMNAPSQDEETHVFEQGFQDMAQQMLMSKVPEIAHKIVTFKIIQSDINSGSAVGAFVLNLGSEVVFVPVILVDNELKPIEMMYVKNSGMFLPLTPEWLSEVESDMVEPMGESVQKPQSLPTDVDVTRVIRPPYESRYRYASAKTYLLDFLNEASNKERSKMANLLKQNPEILKAAIGIYGKDNLFSAISPRYEKVAASKESPVFVATRATSAAQMKRVFGADAPHAMRKIASKGYAVKDTREHHTRAVKTETKVILQETESPGLYRLMKGDGKTVNALVVPDPIDVLHGLHNRGDTIGRVTNEHTRKVVNKSWNRQPVHEQFISNACSQTLIITSDGESCEIYGKAIGEPLPNFGLDNKDGPLKNAGRPVVGSYGVFVRPKGLSFEATNIVYINSVSEDKEGVRRIGISSYKPVTDVKGNLKANQFGQFQLVTDKEAKISRIRVPKESNVRYLPEDFMFVPCKEKSYELGESIIKDPSIANAVAWGGLEKHAHAAVSVFKKDGDDYYTTGDRIGRSKIATIMKLIYAHDLAEKDAEEILSEVDQNGRIKIATIRPDSMMKLALNVSVDTEGKESKNKKESKKQISGGNENPKMAPVAQGPDVNDPGMEAAMGAPGGAEMPMEDPSMGGMPPGEDPAMNAGSPPMGGMGGPSPLDIAVQEVQEKIQQIHAQKEQEIALQIKSLEDQLRALEAVQLRTQEVSQGVPREQSQALTMHEQSVSQPSRGQDLSEQDLMEGSSEEGPPEGSMPGADAPLDHMPDLDQEHGMDPNLMQQASGLYDPTAFDVSAISSLAEHSTLTETISNYMPTLTKSLDHLGRVLVTLWMKGDTLKGELGEERYNNIEDKLRNIFKGVGDLLLNLNQNGQMIRPNNKINDDATAMS